VGEATLEGATAATLTFSAKTKTTLATIGYVGESCALSGVQPVTGKFVMLAPMAQVEATSHLAKATSASSLKSGSSAAMLTVSALLKLASGEPWSFL
jgi:hypothetical protein